jgi:hypothetical protein
MNNQIPPTGLPIPFERTLPPTEWPAAALPDGMREAAEAIAKFVDAPLPLAGFAVVAAVSHIAQRIADAQSPTNRAMPCSLYILSLADSGDRKSECYRIATQPIRKREIEQRQQHQKQCEKIKREALDEKNERSAAKKVMDETPPDPRTLYTEGTLESIARDFVNGSRPALSLSTDEGGQFFGGHSMKSETRANAIGTLIKLFDGGGIERNRVSQDSNKQFRYGIRFGVFLSAQAIAVHESLNDPLLKGQGLLPRFLFSAPASLAGTRFVDKEKLLSTASNSTDIYFYWDTLERMDKEALAQDEFGALDLPEVPLDDDALELWIQEYNEVERQLGKNGEMVDIKPFASRAGELARRLATVFAIWRHYYHHLNECPETPRISERGMAMAWALTKYSLSEWKRQFGCVLSPVEKDAKALLEWMQKVQSDKQMSGFYLSYIAQHCPNQLRKDLDRRNAAIAELINRRWLIDRDIDLHLVSTQ